MQSNWLTLFFLLLLFLFRFRSVSFINLLADGYALDAWQFRTVQIIQNERRNAHNTFIHSFCQTSYIGCGVFSFYVFSSVLSYGISAKFQIHRDKSIESILWVVQVWTMAGNLSFNCKSYKQLRSISIYRNIVIFSRNPNAYAFNSALFKWQFNHPNGISSSFHCYYYYLLLSKRTHLYGH